MLFLRRILRELGDGCVGDLGGNIVLDEVLLDLLAGLLGVLLGELEDLLREKTLDELTEIRRTVDEGEDDLVVGETLSEVLQNLRVLTKRLPSSERSP